MKVRYNPGLSLLPMQAEALSHTLVKSNKKDIWQPLGKRQALERENKFQIRLNRLSNLTLLQCLKRKGEPESTLCSNGQVILEPASQIPTHRKLNLWSTFGTQLKTKATTAYFKMVW